MTDIQTIASGVSNNSTDGDKFRNTFEAIGLAADNASTSTGGKESAEALLKGILAEYSVAAGAGDGSVNGNPNLLDDGLAAIGTQQDTPATDATGVWSGISIAKGILVTTGLA